MLEATGIALAMAEVENLKGYGDTHAKESWRKWKLKGLMATVLPVSEA